MLGSSDVVLPLLVPKALALEVVGETAAAVLAASPPEGEEALARMSAPTEQAVAVPGSELDSSGGDVAALRRLCAC